jgi:broad specificity phosphatase PhoE
MTDFSNLKNHYFVQRHGKSKANEEGIIVSHPENGIGGYGLAVEGKNQVQMAVEKAKNDKILDSNTIIISSDFSRTMETAEIAKQVLGADAVIPSPKLRERNFGEWEKTGNESYEKVWEDDIKDPNHKVKNVESVQEVQDRTTSLIADLEEKYKGKNILLVSHGDALQILQTAFENVPSSHHRTLRHLETAEIRRLN